LVDLFSSPPLCGGREIVRVCKPDRFFTKNVGSPCEIFSHVSGRARHSLRSLSSGDAAGDLLSAIDQAGH
jgi:hypothetical protein